MPPLFAEARFSSGGVALPEKVEVVRESFAHELAVITLRDNDLSASHFRSDRPVKMVWGHGSPGSMTEFVGYVNHVEPVIDREEQRRATRSVPLVDVVCVGASRAFRSPRSRSWSHTRLDLLAREIALEHRFSSVIDHTSEVLVNTTQGGEGSWVFLSEQAKSQGMLLYPRGTELHLRNRDSLMVERQNHALVFTPSNTSLRGVVGEFNPTERESLVREGYGVQGNTLVARSTRTRVRDVREFLQPAPVRAEIVRGDAFRDASDITDRIESDRRSGKYLYQIKATVPPVTSLGVGSVFVLDGFGVRYDGPWIVERARFRGTRRDGLECDVSATRYVAEGGGFIPRYSGTVPQAEYGRRSPRTILVAGTWVAEAA